MSQTPRTRAAARPRRRTALLTATLAAASAAAVLPAAPTAAAGATLDRRLSSGAITESSGLARSTYDRDVLWTHNDSGGDQVLYAVGKDGQVKSRVSLGGASFRDWEDIATGPDHTLWVGDIGDNSKRRSHITAYRIAEPSTLSARTAGATRFDLSYPDGRHNAEALMVHPRSGRVYVVTKDDSGGGIYVAPDRLRTGSVNRMTRVGPAPVKVTAGAFTPSGDRFVLCNYSKAYVYDGFRDRPTVVDKPSLNQGESLEVTRGGGAMLMGSEGSNSPVYRVPLP